MDLFTDQFSNSSLLKRLNVYVSRSRGALLDVHIYLCPINSRSDPFTLFNPPIDSQADGTILTFFTAIGPRIQSLKVTPTHEHESRQFSDMVFTMCFTSCTPGILTEVSLGTSIEIDSHQDKLTKSMVETLWLSVKILRLSTYDINWNSKAYHGLTELRLKGYGLSDGSKAPNISTLVSIFQSSPQLCIFELGSIQAVPSGNIPSAPIRLDELEILALGEIPDEHLATILPLIAPGSKPLSLSIHNPYWDGSEFVSKGELQKFVARSNITRLCANEFRNYSQLAEVLSLMPAVRTLAVHCLNCDVIREESKTCPNFPLDSLYVIRSKGASSFTWPSIEMFVKRHCVRKLTLWKYDFRCCGISKDKYLPDNLYTVCPVVTVLPDKAFNPVEEWY